MSAALPLWLVLCALTLSAVWGTVLGRDTFSDGGGVRRKRSTTESTMLGLTQEQHDLSLELHNQYRRLINASNMEKMRYNMVLAEMAYNLTESCWMRHWWPATWPNQPFITYDTGQNLYASNSATLDIYAGVAGWYDEIKVYDYKENKCTTDQCGHFTQLVWADSFLAGCAYSFCPEFTRPDGSKTHNFHFYACNYGHAGNVQGRLPWKEGAACSGCDSGYFWCDNEAPRGLCVSKYNGSISVPPGITCTPGGCLNGGVLGCDCQCKCTAEFQGKFCEKPCVTEPGCGTSYPKSYCTLYPNPMLTRCPGLCGLCGKANPEACVFETPTPEVKTTTNVKEGETTSSRPALGDVTTVVPEKESELTTVVAPNVATSKKEDGITTVLTPNVATSKKERESDVTTVVFPDVATSNKESDVTTVVTLNISTSNMTTRSMSSGTISCYSIGTLILSFLYYYA